MHVSIISLPRDGFNSVNVSPKDPSTAGVTRWVRAVVDEFCLELWLQCVLMKLCKRTLTHVFCLGTVNGVIAINTYHAHQFISLWSLLWGDKHAKGWCETNQYGVYIEVCIRTLPVLHVPCSLSSCVPTNTGGSHNQTDKMLCRVGQGGKFRHQACRLQG